MSDPHHPDHADHPAQDLHHSDAWSHHNGLSVDPGRKPEDPPPPPPKRPGPKRRQLTTDDYENGITSGDRAILGRALTLIESNNTDHQAIARELLTRLMPRTGKAHRVGITGVPGVGKSTFIEALGQHLTAKGHKVAVLAVDPSSGVSGGSILGDKTRMAKLSTDINAFIRPSPSAGTLGGVARKTRETLLVCEAAGYDVVLVETVGVGQSETVVAEMTDTFLALMLPGAGDELQGIKRGLLELVDVLAINKADGDNATRARRAASEHKNALRYTAARDDGWAVPVLTMSALTSQGVDELWDTLVDHRKQLHDSGLLDKRRRTQLLRWMWSMVDDQLRQGLRRHPAVAKRLPDLEASVRAGETPPTVAAAELLEKFLRSG